MSRAAKLCRDEMGPLIPCEECDGSGEVTHYSYSERPGPFGMDPRYGREVECPVCEGAGEVVNEDYNPETEIKEQAA